MPNTHWACNSVKDNRARSTLLGAILIASLVGSSACGQPPAPTELAAAAMPPDSQVEAPGLSAAPSIDLNLAVTLAPGVTVIRDPRVAFVPNIGIIEGTEAVLVVDTGLGPENGAQVLSMARKIAGQRRIYLTTTHFHPEHSFGASAFIGHATIIMNEAQAEELKEKGQAYIDLFKTFGPQVASALEGTQLVEPNQWYTGEMVLDLGGREIILREIPAHTRGDQMVYVPDVDALFTGDIAETRFFPIMPDADSNATSWIAVLRQLEKLAPDFVVPGHGAVGQTGLLTTLRLHIEFMRDRVADLVAEGRDQQAITHLLLPAITAIYPSWDNQVFIPFEIAILYAEATGKAPQLPDF